MSYPDLPHGPPSERPTRLPHQFVCEARFSQRGGAWIALRGELDLATSPRFERTVRAALSRAPLVIIDLRQLTFADSTAIHRISEAEARARDDGRRLVFVRGPAQVDRMFDLAGLSERVRIIDLKAGVVPGPALPTPAPIDAA